MYGEPPLQRAVISPLPFDVIRINRKIAQNDHPGIGIHEARDAVRKLEALAYCVDGINKVVSGFHQAGISTLLKTLPALINRLTCLGNP
jgi:hypothetical protein